MFEKSRFVLLFDRPSFPKKVVNKISRVVGLRLKRGLVSIEGRRGEVFWGSALWALTGACVDHILATAHQQTLRRFFATAFTADETFFHTIVFNSTFAARTPAGVAEPEAFGLTEWRNLHYFEYPKEVLILTEKDYVFLRQRPEMFIRKVSTTASTVLLDRLDVDHAIERSMARAIQSCRI